MVGFLVSAHSGTAPAEFKGAQVMDQKEKEFAERLEKFGGVA